MVKIQSNLFQKFWISQKKPILFFGFIILAIGLGFYSSYNNTLLAKKWSIQVTSQVTKIENEVIILSKQTEESAKKNQVENLLNEVNDNSKMVQSQDDQVNLKSYNLKLYYLDYLDIHKKNLTKIQANLLTGSKLEKLDGWDIRMKDQLEILFKSLDKGIQYPKTKIIEEYNSGKKLESKLEDYIKQSSDTVLIGKLVSSQDYYKSIINWYEKTDWFQEATSVLPTNDQITAMKTELDNLTKAPKRMAGLFTQVSVSSLFTVELVNSKNSLIKIIKRVNG